MNDRIKESDWKIFKELSPLALQRYCERVMKDVDKIIHLIERDAHERYIVMYKTVRDGDKSWHICSMDLAGKGLWTN